jgi:hypothetical protein
MAAGLLALSLGACGGSSHPASTATKPPAKSQSSGGPSVMTGPVHATLSAATHRPVATKNWTYTITATDAQGHPLSGTVLTEFAFQGTVEGKETPPIHRLRDGHLKDTIQFPKMAVGFPIELQAVVRTSQGTVTLDWPVTVQK